MAQLELFLQTIISGFLLGGLYGLIALGMALIMGVMRVINLAHGDFMMIAMYMSYWLFTLFGIDPYLSVFIAAPALFLFGLAIQKYLLTPVMKVESILPHNQVIMTVGLAMVFSNLATVFFTGNYRSTPVSYASSAWYLTDYWKSAPIELSLSIPWTLSFLIAVVFTIALWVFLIKTDTGKSIRATAQDLDASLLMGKDGHFRCRVGPRRRGRVRVSPHLLPVPVAGQAIHQCGVRHYGHRRHGFDARSGHRWVDSRDI
jgi:branched-chain amino acid transport system permease protein